ncbi:MAG: SPOR domain-containing protein [Cohaesibacteraceae bacterium]
MTTAGKRPQPAPGTEDNTQLDPLEELARIMNDSNPKDPNRRSDEPEAGSGSADAAGGDALDLGLGADGLERYFQDPNFSPESQLSGPLGGSSFDDSSLSDPLQPGAGQPTDDVLAGLDFNNLDLPGLNEPISAPAPAQEQDPEPLLSQHLTPRQVQQPPAVSPQPAPPPLATSSDAPIAEDDLLAAMDQLALDDDPAWAAATAAPSPVNSPTATPSPAAEPPAFNAEAEPSFTPFSSQPVQSEALLDEGSHTYGTSEPDQFDDLPSEKSSGSGRTIALALGVLALIGLTGVVIYGLFVNNGSDAGSPQLIAAPAGDNKEEPEITTNEERVPGEAVFTALDESGQGTDAAPRVVLPGPGSTQLDLGANTPPPSADIAPAAPGSTAARPVRTVTVRADGTVVESTSAPVSPAISAEVPAEQPVAAPQPVPVQTVASQIGAVALDAPATQQTQNAARLPAGETPVSATSQTVSATQTATTTPAVPPQPTARPATTPQPVVTQPAAVTTPSSQPIQLAAPTNAPATPAPAQPVQTQAAAPTTQVASAPALPSSVAPGDFIVQLASLRSEEQARSTFSALQSRFGSILTGFSPNIQEVDLGDRGIYHRVRLGPMDRADAASLCQRYQAAGGDCFVQRQ